MSEETVSNTLLILAPAGRDAELARAILQEGGLTGAICADIETLVNGIDSGAGGAIVTLEALARADIGPLVDRLRAQEPWSDFPFIVLTDHRGGIQRGADATRLTQALGNVKFLERPFHPTTFVSLARSAVRGRLRQYEVRGLLEEVREGERRLQEALHREQYLSQQVVTSVPAGIWTYDTNGIITSWNPYLERLFGLDAFRVVGRPAVEAIPFLQSAGALERMRKAYAGLVSYAPMVQVRAGHQSLVCEVRHAPLRDQDGRPTGGIAFVQDVTERVRAEEQLRHSQKMDSIGQLTGGVAHDFNNLLTAILGSLELLRKRLPGDDEKTSRLIEGAIQGAERGASLTKRLLAFARKQDLATVATDMAELVRGMTAMLERAIGQTVVITYDVPAGLPPALVDRNQVELALLNLAINARDAMPDGGELMIRIDHHDEASSDKHFIRLFVVDTGAGMDKDTLARAIEPFFSTKEMGKGTGLGLSTVHGLANQLGGKFILRSTLGKGTTAELWLPVSERPADAGGVTVTPKAARRSCRILMVDDDPLIAMNAADMLEDLGHAVILVHSGAKALEVLTSAEGIDLLITDYAMPRMTGLELSRKARELRPGLPIILATGYAELPNGDGEFARLAKPYLQSQLAAHIAAELEGKDRPA